MSRARLKVLYLLGVAAAAFTTRRPELLAALCVLQAGLWAWNGLPARELVRLARKLWLLALLLVGSYALLPGEAAPGDAWKELVLLGRALRYNESGLMLGLAMTLRMLAVIAASRLVQATGEPGELVAGLRGLLMPDRPAQLLDATLTLLGGEGEGRGGGGDGRGGGRGDGGGGGRHRREREAAGFSPGSLKSVLRGDLGFVVDAVAAALERARERRPGLSHDAAVLSGLCALMLGTKLLKVLPGIPFAPGYKITFIIPLYILAARLTQAPLGATLAGTVVGVLSFLMGDGRFGVFDVLKHVAPGLVVDAARPLMPGRSGGAATAFYAALGALAALARLSTTLAVLRFVEGGSALYLLAGFQGLSQLCFGALSGLVTAALLGSLERLRAASRAREEVGSDG